MTQGALTFQCFSARYVVLRFIQGAVKQGTVAQCCIQLNQEHFQWSDWRRPLLCSHLLMCLFKLFSFRRDWGRPTRKANFKETKSINSNLQWKKANSNSFIIIIVFHLILPPRLTAMEATSWCAVSFSAIALFLLGTYAIFVFNHQ